MPPAALLSNLAENLEREVPLSREETIGALEERGIVAELIRNGEPWSEALDRAGELLEIAGGMRALLRLTPAALDAFGMTALQIERLQAAARLALRLAETDPGGRPLNAARLRDLFWPSLSLLAHEELHLALLDGTHRFVGRRRLASGGSAALSVHVRDVLAPVLAAGRPAFALVHNHPSGASNPSPEDVQFSARIEGAATVLGLRFVDHLVLSDDGFASALPGEARWSTARSIH